MRSKPTRPQARHGADDSVSPVAARGRRADAAGSLLRRLSPGVMEPLESRLHLSVSRDANGYTVVAPSSDSKLIYVSNSGNDANAGTIGAPVATIAAARALARNGKPDQILFRRGDSFSGKFQNWTLSGRSTSEPLVIGAYTDPSKPSDARPKINTGMASGFTNDYKAGNLGHVYIMGLAFEANLRNYRTPPAGFTVGYLPDAQGGSYGVNILANVDDMLVEDCQFQYFRMGLTFQYYDANGDGVEDNPSNVQVRKNVIIDNYCPSFDAAGNFITSEGMYSQGVHNLTIEQNVFDHNGWMDPQYGNYGCIQDIYNHNAYLNIYNENVLFTGNIVANSGSHGVQMRAGGVATNNLFINQPIAMSFGYLNGAEKPGGVYGEISGNVIWSSRAISGDPRGWGLEISNLKPKSQGGGTIVKNNIYTSYATGGREAIELSFGTNVKNPETAVGINDLTLQNNVVYAWSRGLYINPGLKPGGTSRDRLTGLTVQNNEFQQISATPIVAHGPAYSAANEKWSGNRYNLIGTTTAATQLFQMKMNGANGPLTLAQWQAMVEPTASTQKIAYPNPTASPGSYNASLGGANDVTAFLAEARLTSSKNYRPQYTAIGAGNYIKAGFAGQRIDAAPPVGKLAASDVTSPGVATETFTVTWSDDNQVNASSIGSGDVRVTGPGGYSQAATLVSSVATGDGSAVTATYSVPATGGAWATSANGTYTVTTVAGQVTDTAGNASPAVALGTFNVAINNTTPTAALAAVATVTSRTGSATLNVTYAAGGGIDVSSIDGDDLLVTGPNGFAASATLVDLSSTANGTPRTATYRIDAPAGGWGFDTNGTYQVSLQNASVRSVSGTGVVGGPLGTFAVAVNVPKAVATAPDISENSTARQTITVTYSDLGGMNLSTIDVNDLRVVGPNGYLANAAAGLTVLDKAGAGTAASPLVVHYSIPAPAGGFTGAWNGTYNVVLNANEVKDLAGVAADADTIGTFAVGVDVDGPVATLNTADVFKGSPSKSLIVTVVYSDASGVKQSTLGTGDIEVTLPDGFTTVRPTYQGVTVSGTLATATYAIPVAAGITEDANGTYSVALRAGEVTDTRGNASPASALGTFKVAVDSEAPVIYVTPNEVANPTKPFLFYVSYSDTPGVDFTTVDDDDFRITGPNGFDQPAQFADIEGEGGSTLATFVVPAPDGGWQVSQNGTYSIVLQPGQVLDLSGNAAAPGVLATFSLNVPYVVAASVVPVTPDPAPLGLPKLTFKFNEPVSGFDLGDLRLIGPGGSNVLNGSQTLTTADRVTFTLNNLAGVTATAGSYTLQLYANGSGVVGDSGVYMQNDLFYTFTLGDDVEPPVDTAAPTVTGLASDITTATAAAATFTVTYDDDVAVKASTIGDGDVVVTGPNGYSQIATFVSVDGAAAGTPLTATYSVPAPAGGWSTAANGTYAVRTRASQVSDTAGNFVAATFVTSFVVNVAATTVDVDPPTFAFHADPVTSATAAARFTVTWSDPSGVNNATIGDGDAIVNGPNGNGYKQVAVLVSKSTAADGSIVATYSVPAPAGGWTAALNGSYAVVVRASQVADLKGNFVTSIFLGSVSVNIGGTPVDTTPPTAAIPAVSPNPRSTAVDSMTVAFSEPVTGFDLSDLTLVRSGGVNLLGTGQSLTTTDNKTFTLTGLTAVTGTAGDYVLTLKSSGTAIADLANNALVTGATAGWTYTAAVLTPTITGVNPNPVPASTSAQNLTISGTNFTAASTVTLKNLTTGSTINATVVSRTTTQIVVTNVFGSTAGNWTAEVKNGTASSGTFAFTTAVPGALGISVSPAQITGKTAVLTALNPGTSTATKFGWSVAAKPSAATAPTFSANNTNAAKTATVTFSSAGSYTLKLTSTTGTTVKTATVTVMVYQALASVSVSPTTASVAKGATKQFAATALDQFGKAMTQAWTFSWDIDAGGVGTISATGLYTGTAAGSAKVRAYGSSTISGTAAVTVTAPAFSSAKVNFQPANASVPAGYLMDAGLTYAARNGQTYGWSVSEADAAVDRNKNSNQALDTNIGIKAGAKWELLVPNGKYTVKLSVGDATVATTNTIRLEGTTVLSGVKLAANAFSAKTATITVSDGKLTLDAGSAASLMTRVDYIEVTKA